MVDVLARLRRNFDWLAFLLIPVGFVALVIYNSDDSAHAGSPYAHPTPKLTLRQLFAVWRTGHLVFDAYYDEIGAVIPDKVYMVGFGFGLTAAVFWGIVPSKKIIVISCRAPGWSVWDPSRMGIFKRAASSDFAIETPSNPKRLST
jgi:hypothetical protein